MEESNEEQNVLPELYFLIAKFLCGGPLKETAKTLLKELESAEVLPRRIDWEGVEHTQTYDELAAQYSDVSWSRLAAVCARALQLARVSPAAALAPPALAPRLSLLGEALVRGRGGGGAASGRGEHSLVRRVARREQGAGEAAGHGVFPARALAGLQLQRRTLGHLSAVYCLVFERSGRYVITGADDLLVKVWSAVDGRLVATLRGAGAEITDASVSRDGALLAVGSVERLVRVWELAGGSPRAVLHAHAGTITSVAWAPPARAELRWLASTSTDGSVAFWTCSADGQFLSQPVQYVERMRPGACHMICAAWSAGGAFLAAGSADRHVRVYAVAHEGGGPRRVLELAVHGDAVDSLAWAHRALRLVSGSKDGTAALWQLHATQWRHVLLVPEPGPDRTRDGKRLKVTMVCWDCSDEFVLTAVSDCTVRVWSARTGRAVRTLRGHRDEAYVLEPHPFLAGVVLSAGHDGQLLVWHAGTGERLAAFTNTIAGQGEGAIFDAKWGGAATIAASDSHGHLLLLGLGAGHERLRQLPTELFFHTDYRPLVRDALGGALDEQTETPPHLMPPPFLVDVEGAPYPPEFQRLVPGREALPLAQLVPAAEAARSRIDHMISALAGEAAPGGGGVWRGEGVRHTAGSWQAGEALQPGASARPIVPPLPRAEREALQRAGAALHDAELAAYRREMRRRPLMISTAAAGEGGPPKRRAPRPRPRPRPPASPQPRPPTDEDSPTDEGDSSVRLSGEAPSSASFTSDSSASSSQYSDWEAGPPARARRRPHAARSNTTQRKESADEEVGAEAEEEEEAEEVPELYRVGEWLTAVIPRKTPYHPQMGDHCMYFRVGHQRYFEAVAEKDLYKVNQRDKPWERTTVYECEPVKVIGVKYEVKPPRVACVRVACALGARARSFTVRYHDMPDVIDFLVLRHQVEAALRRCWAAGDRFRCVIDDQWWSGAVVEGPADEPPPAGAASADERLAHAAARAFLAVRVRWDNGELERLSPWDLEPPDPAREPPAPGAAVPALPHELRASLYRCEPGDWAGGAPEDACAALAAHLATVMTLAVAEPFAAPLDLQRHPRYARLVPYPVDLATMRARFQHAWYRRAAAAQWDARQLASGAERARHPAVRAARLLAALLLRLIARWRDADVLAEYRALAARPEPAAAPSPAPAAAAWRARAAALLAELLASPDAAPFRRAVSPSEAPDYATVIARPMDLGTVGARLAGGLYSHPAQFAADVRLVFSNSRTYNTNKRSRIYSMTVRLAALFEALWARMPLTTRRRRRPPRRSPPAAAPDSDEDEEPLAAASRRKHRAAPRTHTHTDDDSWDSDLPLHTHRRKGKGVGKKSRRRNVSSEPVPSTSAVNNHHTDDEEYIPQTNGVCSGSDADEEIEERLENHNGDGGSSSSHYTNIEVLEEELEEEVELTYTDSDEARPRKRRRASVGSRDSSERSFVPSSDEDAPLQRYARDTRRVKLRARPRRQYNEDSESDSALAISKRNTARLTGAGPSQPLSVSSRGRVRRLTAKAAGLLPHHR